MSDLTMLSVDCVTHIISFTSPLDACRLSIVSPNLKSVADSDVVWEKFLPSDYREIVSQSSSPNLLSLPKKQLFLHLCDNPIFIANGKMTFGFDKRSGKKWYMLGARALYICWGDTPRYWRWQSIPESRFSEVAELRHVWWFDVKGMIETRYLSPNTTYVVYLVYRIVGEGTPFQSNSVELHLHFEVSGDGERRRVFLEPWGNETAPLVRRRGDGWMEVEIGRFFKEHGDDGKVVCSVQDTDDWLKEDLLIEGVEIRPIDENSES